MAPMALAIEELEKDCDYVEDEDDEYDDDDYDKLQKPLNDDDDYDKLQKPLNDDDDIFIDDDSDHTEELWEEEEKEYDADEDIFIEIEGKEKDKKVESDEAMEEYTEEIREINDRDENESVALTLTNINILDCSFCSQALNIPVLECANGHLGCSSCSKKLNGKCFTCSYPWPLISTTHSKIIENILQSAKIACKNSIYGCKEITIYNDKHIHETICIYSPCSCPVQDCTFIGSSKVLCRHFRDKHHDAAKSCKYDEALSLELSINDKFVILQEENEGNVFILSNILGSYGYVVSVGLLGSCSESEKSFIYSIQAKTETGAVRVISSMEKLQGNNYNKVSSTGFVLIPCFYFGFDGKVQLEICIRHLMEN
ncbi:E3 ubiquitin-protein ligase SINA-like 10 [Mercurialis annua]|uniref:E3 ubiquitin-protein ligase SINA-like 10 n=1 Tax=Mercurialis annua TaxID=3986 RepID=UPI002160B014|nr:E3 ubiquitin-protein ligase SINA-like 10 [Mercurialis annua]